MAIDHDPYCDDGSCTTCFPANEVTAADYGVVQVPDIPVTKTSYVLQYLQAGEWLVGSQVIASDGESGAVSDSLARARETLEFVRQPSAQSIFPREWRLVARTTTETVVDPAPAAPQHGYETPPTTAVGKTGTSLAVQARDGYVEVGWSRYSIEQSDELIAAIQRAQLKAAEQR